MVFQGFESHVILAYHQFRLDLENRILKMKRLLSDNIEINNPKTSSVDKYKRLSGALFGCGARES